MHPGSSGPGIPSHWLALLSQGKSQLILKIDPCPPVGDISSWQAAVCPQKAVSPLVTSDGQRKKAFPMKTPNHEAAELLIYLPT